MKDTRLENQNTKAAPEQKMCERKNALKGSRISCCFMVIKATVCICAALGWWGVLYPELTLMPGTYAIAGEETAGGKAVQKSKEVVKWKFNSDIYEKLLEAEAGQIQFKSKLLLMLRSISGENCS